MGHYSDMQDEEAIRIVANLDHGYKIQFVAICGRRILDKDNNPVTNFYSPTDDVTPLNYFINKYIGLQKDKDYKLKIAEQVLKQPLDKCDWINEP